MYVYQDFDEFCSLYDDLLMRLDHMRKFDKMFHELSQDGTSVETSQIRELINGILYPADKLDCPEEERRNMVNRLVILFSYPTTTHVVNIMHIIAIFKPYAII
jgi:hypothetical protein